MGHLAVGLASKRATPSVPVVALVLATIASDIGEIGFGLANVHGTPYTHTLPADLGWAAIAGMIGLVLYGRPGLLLAALAATHVPLDWLTSSLPVTTDGPVIGLALYARPMIDLAMEIGVIAVGWWIYRSTLAPERRNHAAAIAMPIALVGFQIVWDLMLSGG